MIITCKCNEDSKVFDSASGVYRLLIIDGLGAEFDVYTSNSADDGEIYQNSKGKKRNIVLTLELSGASYEDSLSDLYEFFQPNAKGTLFLYNKKIDYYVESVIPSNAISTVTISLICPNPVFHDAEDTVTEMAATRGLLVFPLTYSPPFKVSEKTATLIADIYNNSSIPTGIMIEFKSTGAVSNPSLVDVYRQHYIGVNADMISDDIIRISTVKGNKKVVLIRNGIEENINNKLDEYSTWLQAYRGDNLFRYDANTGINNLSVKITTNQSYWGV